MIADIAVDQKENCFPMIPCGAAHNEMILGPEHEGERAPASPTRAWCWSDADRRRPPPPTWNRHAQLDTTMRTATISVLVDNEAGVLARVIGLFSGRGYNIDSLTVAPVDDGAARAAASTSSPPAPRW